MPNYKNIHASFKLNGLAYTKKTLQSLAASYKLSNDAETVYTGVFLDDWLDDKDYVIVKTSGSTGAPKSIKLDKQAMVNSALATGVFFNLSPRDIVLQCLSSTYIAGKMMLVRAMVLGLEIDLIAPSSKPLDYIEKHYEFCAMVPLQLEQSFDKLHQIKTLIVGGAAVSQRLYDDIMKSSCAIYETYGMTETITHIAVKPINTGESSNFKILPNVEIQQDERQCLVINAPHVNVQNLVTNDVVELISDSEFQLLGRYDNVINTGGVKVFPEQIEKKLNMVIKERFFIASQPDEVLGQKVILVIESSQNNLNTNFFNYLEKFEKPKEIYTIAKFLETSSGKIQRQKTLDAIFRL